MAGRTDPPGWDDISDSGSTRNVDRGGGPIRCIALPVHDLDGTTKYIIAFGAGYPVNKAQCLAERLALMLGPLVEQELGKTPKGSSRRLAPDAATNFRKLLEREIATANSRAIMDNINNQVEQVNAASLALYHYAAFASGPLHHGKKCRDDPRPWGAHGTARRKKRPTLSGSIHLQETC